MRRLLTFLVMVFALLGPVAAAPARPTCKDSLEQNDPEHESLVKGYYYSILFMMGMPFAILGTFGGLAYLSIRRAQRQQHDLLQQPTSESPVSRTTAASTRMVPSSRRPSRAQIFRSCTSVTL